MTPLVVDASVAIKWIVKEDGTDKANLLLDHTALLAPDLLIAECANILWKKVRRDELAASDVQEAARLLMLAEIELVPMRSLIEEALRLSIVLDHPAYDCMYLALAASRECGFLTADQALLRKLASTTIGIELISLSGYER